MAAPWVRAIAAATAVNACRLLAPLASCRLHALPACLLAAAIEVMDSSSPSLQCLQAAW